jgi:hypothetical protein
MHGTSNMKINKWNLLFGASLSLNAIVAQIKNCPFRVNTTVEFKTITTTNNNCNNKQVNKQSRKKVSTIESFSKYENQG